MPDSRPSIYDFSAPLLNGSIVSLKQFEGKVLLIVNTASRCGFTPQYAGLEGLYRTFKGRGFEVLGFPCNQFGRQEPGSAQEIQSFCTTNYQVTFPMFTRIDVNGPKTHPLFRFLKEKNPGRYVLFCGSRIKWNFTKFLVARNGNVVQRFGPSIAPDRLADSIDALLNQS